MTARIVGPIVVKNDPAPSARGRRGRAGKWAPVYAALMSLRPGEWFEVPMPRDADVNLRVECVSAVRRYLREYEIDGVVVYRDESDAVIVRADR